MQSHCARADGTLEANLRLPRIVGVAGVMRSRRCEGRRGGGKGGRRRNLNGYDSETRKGHPSHHHHHHTRLWFLEVCAQIFRQKRRKKDLPFLQGIVCGTSLMLLVLARPVIIDSQENPRVCGGGCSNPPPPQPPPPIREERNPFSVIWEKSVWALLLQREKEMQRPTVVFLGVND